MEKKLPKNWVHISFTEVFDINGGTQPPKSQFIYEPREGYIRLLQIRDFGKKPVPTYIPNTGKLRTCKKEDVLIARYGASIGRILTGMEGAYNVALAKVNIPELIDKKYTLWLLKSNLFQNFITSFQRTAQSGFNKNDLTGINVPIAPLQEQQRIVKKLDTLFSELDIIKSRLEKIPELLKNLRQVVLSQAVSGKLLNNNNFITLGELGIQIKTGPFGSALHKSEYIKNGIPIINPSHIKKGKIIPNKNVTITNDKARNLKRWFLDIDDIILGRRGEMGRSALYNKKYGKMICGTGSLVLKCSKNISPMFLDYYLRSSFCINFLENNSVGSTMINLNQKIVKSLPFPNLTIDEQNKSIIHLKNLFNKADKIEKQYFALKGKLEVLPQSILHKAFKGELVEQLSTDGDANELLKQINKLKEEINKKGKKKK